MSKAVVKGVDELERARTWLTGALIGRREADISSAFALIAIAEQLRELNAQLKRNARDHWQLP